MPAPRLATGFWLAAWRARMEAAHRPVYRIARGDDTAGAVQIKAVRGDGTAALWAREWDLATDRPAWRVIEDGPEAAVDAAIARARARDPDLWVFAVDAPDGMAGLEGPGLD